MKKIITLIILLTNLIGNAQCPAPSNLVYSAVNIQDALLSWTENGTANTWNIAAAPNFYVGAPLPLNGWITVASNPFTYLSVPPGCNVFFVRSVCSTTVSAWTAVASSECPINTVNYLATLSNNNFSINNDKSIKIFPNPSSTIFKIVSDTKVDKITLFDALGKEILIQSQNNSEVNVEKLSKGIYLIEIISENEKIYRKFIKE
jgi:Secretion system C-terminal sorting domain